MKELNNMSGSLKRTDPEVAAIVAAEETRQQEKLSLIPSENFFSASVREAVGSVFAHKYAEGNIGKRYYEGNQYVDELESLAIARVSLAFNLPADWTANVQALSGSNANLAVYLALLEMGDTIMAMYLPDGGHLSHGWSFEPDKEKRLADIASGSLVYKGGSRKINLTSKMFEVVQYKTQPATQMFNYDELEKIAVEYKPKLIITGGTAYPRDIDYGRVRQIADKIGAMYLADIAHEAGLIAAGVLPSPVGIADVVTMTTHKTLRAGRGAIVLGSEELIKKVDWAIIPGLQGGPHNHNIAGICVGLGEAIKPEFKVYAQQVIDNARVLADELAGQGFKIVSGGTDKHLILVDLTDQPLLGKKFARALDYAGVVSNANSMPQEKRGPADPSALRVGTPWVTTRGMKEEQMTKIAGWMKEVIVIAGAWGELEGNEYEVRLAESTQLAGIASQVKELCLTFPLEIEQPELATVNAKGGEQYGE